MSCRPNNREGDIPPTLIGLSDVLYSWTVEEKEEEEKEEEEGEEKEEGGRRRKK